MGSAAAPQRLGRDLGRGLGEDIQNHVCSSSSDQNYVDSASVMSVAWRAGPFCLSANRQIWSLEGEETHPRANQPGLGTTVAKAISNGKSEGAGETPPRPHKGLPPKAAGNA